MQNKVLRSFMQLVLVLCVLGLQAQTIKDGSRWWDGGRLYTAQVDASGMVKMNGESEDMGGDRFLLKPVVGKNGCYTIAADNKYGWIFIRGEVGWRVDYVQQENLNFLAVRNPNGDCVYTMILTPDNLKNCVAQQRIAEEREVSWMLQNQLLNVAYLGRFSKPQLRLLRNEILARHGWRFQSKDLQQHFGSQSWYTPVADNNTIKLSLLELTNLQLLKSEEAVEDENRVRYENIETAPKMAEVVDGVITVTTEEQLINALGNDRTIQIGANVHLNLSRILGQENKFAGVAGRGWVTVVKRGGSEPVIISEFCTDGQQLTLKNFRRLTIRGERNASIEVDPRYAFCLNYIDCVECKVENLTIGHTEGGYCDGGVIGVEGGSDNQITDCDLYGCGTYGIVARETNGLTVSRTNIHHCTYGIMELWSSRNVKFVDCDFFNNREYELIANRSSVNTVFKGCRFFGNWADAPLFQSDEDIMLFNCEVHHQDVGTRERLITPEDDCTFDGNVNFNPESRQSPIGPDAAISGAEDLDIHQIPKTAVRVDSYFQYAVYVNVDQPSSGEGEVDEVRSVWLANERMGTARKVCVTNPMAPVQWERMKGKNPDAVSVPLSQIAAAERAWVAPGDVSKVIVEGCPDSRNIWTYIIDPYEHTALQLPSTEGVQNLDWEKKEITLASYSYDEDGRYSFKRVYSLDGKFLRRTGEIERE